MKPTQDEGSSLWKPLAAFSILAAGVAISRLAKKVPPSYVETKMTAKQQSEWRHATRRLDYIQDKFQSGRYMWQSNPNNSKSHAPGNSTAHKARRPEEAHHDTREQHGQAKPHQKWTGMRYSVQEPDQELVNKSLAILGLQAYRLKSSRVTFSDPLTLDTLKRAYKRQVMVAHPDHLGGSEERFRAVTEAYNHLRLKLEA